jgi:4-aminobutyrate aminotransferase/(S)-3-amino-2-methylpropionate transaminase
VGVGAIFSFCEKEKAYLASRGKMIRWEGKEDSMMTKYIQLVTQIPGPRSKALLERKNRVVPDALSIYSAVAAEKAEGAMITDVDGNRLIDLAGGLGCMNMGHSHPDVVRAIQEQAARFTHTDFSVMMYESYIQLAERLTALAPGTFPKKAAFFNSGAEAVENAVKIARAYTRRRAVIAFEGAFHGRTLLTMSLTSKTAPYKEGFGPFAPEIYRLPFPYPYRSRHPETVARECAETLERALITTVSPKETAAVILEPVQGEGGFVVPPTEFLHRVREICDQHGILLIADEIQTGFGRTGRMFAMEHFGVAPDLMTVGKSIAAGLPLSGVIGRQEVMDAPGDSAIGGTYVGNPLACQAALAVLDIFEKENLLDKAERMGNWIRHHFHTLAESMPQIGEVRGIGAMVAVELVRDPVSKEPASEETASILKRAMERGVIAVKAGIYGNVIRMLAPFVIQEEPLREALTILEEEMRKAFR